MKKFLYITMVLVISLSFVACGSKTTTDASKTSKAATTTPAKITYTKDLAYLPTYNGVKSAKYTAKTKKTLATSKYTLKNTTDVKVFNDYQAILKKDGWTITGATKSTTIFAKKGTHIANIIVQKMGKDKDVILMISSK
ncbi:hypothetical protein LL033_14655 [Clostridium estertheticum]|uniref:hypothetical protein n=1 Tax=Clostridium estertheticum TaxID=238834 RepID=UPI001C0E3110|nr:hypothetical protein [Clostridium estertheticum]MBU3218201.1 hypothetical protein [Clostridium estertheticum]WAG53887.1 hypothetical protein LL033_14655 [Clostridium estertheticum]